MDQLVGSSTPDGLAPLSGVGVIIIMLLICIASIVYGIINCLLLLRHNPYQYDAGQPDAEKLGNLVQMARKTMLGIIQFLKYVLLVCLLTGIIYYLLIMIAIQKFDTFFSSTTYIVGMINSIFLAAMTGLIASWGNSRVCYGGRESMAFAYQLGKLASNAQTYFTLGWTLLLISSFLYFYEDSLGQSKSLDDIKLICQGMVAFSAGSATVSVIMRICSSIYAKGVDVAFPLMRTIDDRVKIDSKNPMVICRGIGQNLNKSMGYTLDFTTIISATITVCIYASGANVIGTDQQGQIIFDPNLSNIYLPLITIAFAIFFSLLFNVVLNFLIPTQQANQIRFCFLFQKLAVFFLMLGFLSEAAYLCLPSQFKIDQMGKQVKHPYLAYLCLLLGMVGSFLISSISQLTTNSPYIVGQITQSFKTGSATGIISGLSFGYIFNCLPVIIITATAFISCYWLGMLGVSLAALGYLTLLPIYNILNVFYSISENASMMAYFCEMREETIQNLVLINSKKKHYEPHIQAQVFGSLILIGISLFLMFVNDSKIDESISMNNTGIILGLFIGAMVPYLFSFFIFHSIKSIPPVLCYDIKGQIQEMPGIIQGTVQIDSSGSTQSYALYTAFEMKKHLLLIVIFSVVIGIILGPQKIVGYMAGLVISGVQLTISFGMSGLIWSSVRNDIYLGTAKDSQLNQIKADSDWGRAAQVGSEVGTQFKDALSSCIPSFILFICLIQCTMSELYVSIHS